MATLVGCGMRARSSSMRDWTWITAVAGRAARPFRENRKELRSLRA